MWTVLAFIDPYSLNDYMCNSSALNEINLLCFFPLLWDGFSDLGFCDLLEDGGRLHLLQRTHNAVLFASMSLNQRIHAVRVKHDVVGCNQQHAANSTLMTTWEKRGKGEELSNI